MTDADRMRSIDECPPELALAIREFWPIEEWDNAASIAWLESGWDWKAENDTRRVGHPCGSYLGLRDGVPVAAEWSIGYFQINVCNYPDWLPGHFFNARQNAGTAHDLWSRRGWQPWYFSAIKLALM